MGGKNTHYLQLTSLLCTCVFFTKVIGQREHELQRTSDFSSNKTYKQCGLANEEQDKKQCSINVSMLATSMLMLMLQKNAEKLINSFYLVVGSKSITRYCSVNFYFASDYAGFTPTLYAE